MCFLWNYKGYKTMSPYNELLNKLVNFQRRMSTVTKEKNNKLEYQIDTLVNYNEFAIKRFNLYVKENGFHVSCVDDVTKIIDKFKVNPFENLISK